MLGNRFKLILLIWPIILLLGFWGNSYFQRLQIDKKLGDADGLVWNAGEDQFFVTVNQREDGELLHVDIKVITPENKEIYNSCTENTKASGIESSYVLNAKKQYSISIKSFEFE